MTLGGFLYETLLFFLFLAVVTAIAGAYVGYSRPKRFWRSCVFPAGVLLGLGIWVNWRHSGAPTNSDYLSWFVSAILGPACVSYIVFGAGGTIGNSAREAYLRRTSGKRALPNGIDPSQQ